MIWLGQLFLPHFRRLRHIENAILFDNNAKYAPRQKFRLPRDAKRFSLAGHISQNPPAA
jgi:hypothetical protein